MDVGGRKFELPGHIWALVVKRGGIDCRLALGVRPGRLRVPRDLQLSLAHSFTLLSHYRGCSRVELSNGYLRMRNFGRRLMACSRCEQWPTYINEFGEEQLATVDSDIDIFYAPGGDLLVDRMFVGHHRCHWLNLYADDADCDLWKCCCMCSPWGHACSVCGIEIWP